MASNRYIVAGGNSGIGLEIARQLLERNCEVVAIGRTAPLIENDRLSHFGYDFLAQENLPEIADPVNGLVYCPGSITLKPVNTLKEEELLRDFQLNAVGAFRFIKAYKNNLSDPENASVLLFSSVAATTGMPFHTSVSMSKGAVEGLTLAMAAELAPKVRVNCIAPSLTDTPLAQQLLSNEAKRSANAERHPLKRIGTAPEVAAMAVFMLTEAKWMTGQIVGVNGGIGSIMR